MCGKKNYVFQTNETSPPADGQEPESTVEGLQEAIRKVEVSPQAVYYDIWIFYNHSN